MLGIVVWTKPGTPTSLVYCSDGLDLAYAENRPGLRISVGTLVDVELEETDGLRKCSITRAIGLANVPDFIKDIQITAPKTQGPGKVRRSAQASLGANNIPTAPMDLKLSALDDKASNG
ncbi:hypothetical protein [Celeribacter arenosi]|uniref:Uncharacterized protein n=1 Tax=Celeribacter arenosi TaxID=792649 RepID=A0ABP7KD80_9RHOB